MKSGFVSIVGRPNVGKSTLLNKLLNKKIAITSDKVGTTRNMIYGVYNEDDTQIVFVDTPGINKATSKLGEVLNKTAYSSFDNDLVLFLVDIASGFGPNDNRILNRLKENNKDVILVLTKVDKIKKDKLYDEIIKLKDLYNFLDIVPISSIKGINTTELIEVIKKYLKDDEIISIITNANCDKLDRFNIKSPCERYLTTGNQICNGYIAINNGGLLGKGLGNSTQKYLYLPEAHTDFIYPIIVEETGIVGATFVLFLYFLLICRILSIAKKTTNNANRLICYGTVTYILSHIIINLLGVTGVIPLTGVPLPFMSYGGSFAASLIVILTVVQRINYEENKKNRKKMA